MTPHKASKVLSESGSMVSLCMVKISHISRIHAGPGFKATKARTLSAVKVAAREASVGADWTFCKRRSSSSFRSAAISSAVLRDGIYVIRWQRVNVLIRITYQQTYHHVVKYTRIKRIKPLRPWLEFLVSLKFLFFSKIKQK